MKNAINYYYNLITNDMHHHNDRFYFTVNQEEYLLLPFYDNISKMSELYNYIISQKKYCHEIIYNKDRQVITIIDSTPYILLKNYKGNRKIVFQDIIDYNIPYHNSNINNWYNKWCQKLDYYEYQIDQFKNKYYKLSQSFPYYDAMTEIAISLYETLNLKTIPLYISHPRINKNTSLRDLYNPINFIIDTRVRDIAEYYKNIFFYRYNPINEVTNYIYSSHLSYEECMLLLIRLLYPSYYFDLYDAIINSQEKESKIDIIVSRASEYEQFLSDVYEYMSKIFYIPEIDWLKKT